MNIINNFLIIKHLNPTWYFNLYPRDSDFFSTSYYNSENMMLSGEAENIIKADVRYSTKKAQDLDIGFRLWNRGYLLFNRGISPEKLFHKEEISLKDNYIFLRKFYKKKIVYYFLFRNILRLSNPIKEIKAFNETGNIKKEDIINPHFEYNEYKDYAPAILEKNPLVSVIIPTLNRYKYLDDVLCDLEKQNYKNFEVIIIDQSDLPEKTFYKKYENKIKLKIIYQTGKGQWLARNEAIRNSAGDYLLFFDDDSRVDPDWIEQHLKVLDFFNAEVSAGVSKSIVGDKVPDNYSFFRWADQFDSGNAMVKREVFEKTGMFDRQFDKQRMGDGEFGLRVYLAGFRSISNPYAGRVHLKVSSGGLRQMGSWDAFRPKNFFAPRPVPSVLYFFRKYFPNEYVFNAILLRLAPSLIPYKWKGKKILLPLSLIAAILILPLLLIQLGISWAKSSKMLKEGDKIELL